MNLYRINRTFSSGCSAAGSRAMVKVARSYRHVSSLTSSSSSSSSSSVRASATEISSLPGEVFYSNNRTPVPVHSSSAATTSTQLPINRSITTYGTIRPQPLLHARNQPNYFSTSTTASSQNQSQPQSPPQPQPQPEPEPTLMERSDKNIFQQIWDKYSVSQQTNRILVAESFLQAAVTQANDPRWYGPGRIDRDFRSYQAVLTMHIWFLHKRLINDNVDPHRAALVQEELFDIFWTDSANRMRAHGVNEWLIGKNLKTVQQYTFMHLFHYDHCYTGDLLDNPEARFEELKNLVKTHILLLSPDDESALKLHDDQSERIAWYIETQYQNIVHDLPDSFYRKARIAWCDLPDFTNLIDGNTGKTLPDHPVYQDDILPSGWLKNIANDGSYYFWNLNTRKAQWERPTN